MKRIIPVILAAMMALAGCGSSTEPQASDSTVTNGANVTDGNATITDGAGHQLAIPENRDDTAIATVYAVSVPFIVALGLSDNVVAVNVKSNFWTQAVEALGKAGTVGRGTVDLEALAEVSPTVLVHRSNDDATVKAVNEKLDIDVLCITVENMDDIKDTLEIMGAYFGREERAEEVAVWMDSKFAMIDEIAAKIPEEERVTALVMGSEPGRVAGGDMLQSWLIEKAGGISVAADVTSNRNWADVGVETIFQWDPDFLFITSSTALDYSIEGITQDEVWIDMASVKGGNVYRIPAKIDTWDMPGISCPLASMFMLYKMYPDYFTAEQLQAEIDEYYNFMFGKTFDSGFLGYDLGE